MQSSGHELIGKDFNDFANVFIDAIDIDGTKFTIYDHSIKLPNGRIAVNRKLSADKFLSQVIAAASLQVPQDDEIYAINTRNLSVNFSAIVHLYAKVMIASPIAIAALGDETKEYNILTIGLGTGIVNGYLHDHFNNVNITVVELKKGMYEIARNYFSLVIDNRQRVVIADGLQFIRDHLHSGGAPFDVIFVDACHNEFREHLICPVESFLEQDNVKLLHNVLVQNGTVVISVLVYPMAIAEEYIRAFRDVFDHCVLLSYPDRMLNQILICGGRVPDKESLNSEIAAVFDKLGFKTTRIEEE